MNKRTVAFLLCTCLFPVLLHARAEGHFNRTLQVNGAVDLDVSTGSGDIVVRTGGANQVTVNARIRGSSWMFGDDSAIHQVESNPPIQQNGNKIRLGYDMPDNVRQHVSISYDITVPADTTLQAQTGSGNIDVAGIRSEVQVHTGSGDIRVRDIGTRLTAQTGSGNITAETVAAPFSAQTGSGDIQADLTGSGDVDVHTGSGTIRIRGVNGPFHARTGSGEISAEGGIVGPWQVHSGSGDIHLAVGTGHGFNLDAHSSSGSIHSELSIMVQGTLGKNELRGTVGGGGPELQASTSSGDIDIR